MNATSVYYILQIMYEDSTFDQDSIFSSFKNKLGVNRK